MFTRFILFVNILLYIVVERRETKIDDNYVAATVNHEIVWLDVRMNDERGVHIIHNGNKLHTDPQDLETWIEICRPNGLYIILQSGFVESGGDARVVPYAAVPKECRDTVDKLSIQICEYFCFVGLFFARDLERHGLLTNAMKAFEDCREGPFAHLLHDFVVVNINVISSHPLINKCVTYLYILSIMVLKTIFENADNMIEGSKRPLYLISSGFLFVGYIAMFLGISYISPKYIRTISNITYVLIALLLMYKFNPLRESNTITEYDSKLISLSASFILFNLGVTEYALSFFDTVKNTFGV
jgi:hypothetical protein